MTVQAADTWGAHSTGSGQAWAEPQTWTGEEDWEWNEPPVGRIGADTVAIGAAITLIGTGGALAPVVLPATAAMYAGSAIVDAGHAQMAAAKAEEVETGRDTSGKVKVGLVVSLLGCGLGGLVAVAVAAFGMAAGR